jgi:endonuclease/exonuclease/phosphatase family metal-dependent hydrolase
MAYKIKVKDADITEDVRIQRGFMHAVFAFPNGYRLHVIGVHLKSRVFNSRYNQTDMRRYEARLLRYFVNEILQKEPDANVLVMGDMNDTYDSEPIRFLRDDKKPREKRLYDLRPADQSGLFWTHWWNQNDVYSRIDYAFASYALVPEINREKTKIVHLPEFWIFASDHRPILITLWTDNAQPPSESEMEQLFPKLKDAPISPEQPEAEKP